MKNVFTRCKLAVLTKPKTPPKCGGLAVHKTGQNLCKLNVNGVVNSCQKNVQNTTASTPPETRFLKG